jgi:eukaryotic-like serine/threonine-protein kinase
MAAKPVPEKAVAAPVIAAEKKPPIAEMPLEKAPVDEPEDELEDEPNVNEISSERTLWIIGTAIVLVLLILLAVRALRHVPDRTHASSNQQAPSQSAPPVIAKPSAASPAIVASSAKPKPASAPPQPAAKPVAPVAATVNAPAGERTGDWRVVAFTYNHQDQAEHKAQTIGERHPDLRAGVFSPRGSGAPYLVTLGGPMDRDTAFQLRNKAIRAGLPRDTYAQNYSR